MDLSRLEPGQMIDGFRLEEPLNPGGMANVWRVTRADTALPLVMKIPFIRPGENPLAIVGFEAEGMILPRLTGPHAPHFIAAGDFSKYVFRLVQPGLEPRRPGGPSSSPDRFWPESLSRSCRSSG